MRRNLAAHLASFEGVAVLRERVELVAHSLPVEVQRDLLDDPRFRLVVDDFVPGSGRSVWLACPDPGGSGSRCVVLKPRLGECSPAFAHYIIAHELAHAFLRNGGWGDVSDPELAADALAAHWGFAKPAD